MFKRILTALQKKFPSVEAKMLEPTAKKLAKTTAKEEDVDAAVEAVTDSQVYETYADFRVSQAVETAGANAIAGYEQKYGLKNGEKVNGGGAPAATTQQPPVASPEGKDDQEPPWSKRLSERLTAIETRFAAEVESAKQRGFQDVIVGILKEKGVRETFYRPMINGRSFETEDAAKAFAETVERDFRDDEQAKANANHQSDRSPQGGTPGNEEVDPLLQAVQEKTESMAKNNK